MESLWGVGAITTGRSHTRTPTLDSGVPVVASYTAVNLWPQAGAAERAQARVLPFPEWILSPFFKAN